MFRHLAMHVESFFAVDLEVYLLLSLVLTCVLTRCEYGGGWVWDARHHCLGLRRCCGPNSFNTDKGRCPLDNPCEMLTKATLLLLLLLLSMVKYWYNGCSAPCLL